MSGDGMYPEIEVSVSGTTEDPCFTTTSDLWTADIAYPGGGYFVFSRPDLIPKGWYHHITFRLVDDGGLDLQFPADEKDAFWVVKCEGGCPSPSAANSDYSAMRPERTDSNSVDGRLNLLRVTNKNQHKETWKFTLNFVRVGGGSQVPVSWDPISQNTDGGAPRW